MSPLNRLIGMASKALGDQQTSRGSARGNGTGDWRDMVRKAADAVTGDSRTGASEPTRISQSRQGSGSRPAPATLSDADRKAIARYDYLVETAEPQELERIHREAFDRLTPEQRTAVQARMREELPANEQPRSGSSDDLARAATRTEMRHPGSLRGLLARVGGRGSGSGRGIGGAVAGAGIGAGAGLALGGVLATVAGGAVLSTVAGPLLEQAAGLGVDFDQLAGGIDLGEIAGLDELTSGVGESISGVGEQIGGLGEQASEFTLGDLGDLFGR